MTSLDAPLMVNFTTKDGELLHRVEFLMLWHGWHGMSPPRIDLSGLQYEAGQAAHILEARLRAAREATTQ